MVPPVADGREYLTTAWWISTWPGVAIGVTVLAMGTLLLLIVGGLVLFPLGLIVFQS